MTFVKSHFVLEKLAGLLGTEAVEIAQVSDGYHNRVFSITRKNDKIVARLSPHSRRTKEEITAELEWIAAVSEAGIQVAKSIQISGHNHIIELHDGENPCLLVFFEHTEGRPVDVTDLNEWNQEFFHEWGRQIGLMHNVQASYVNRVAYLDSEGKETDTVVEWLRERRERLLEEMCSWEREQETFGLVHNDLHQGNFHANEKGLIFFDFDDCTYHFYAQDLAVSIYHALWTGTAFHPDSENFPVDFLTSFLEGYATNRRLKSVMYDQLLVCLQMREVYLFALFSSQWNEEEMIDWQIDKLRELEMNIKTELIPYKEELEKTKHLFE